MFDTFVDPAPGHRSEVWSIVWISPNPAQQFGTFHAVDVNTNAQGRQATQAIVSRGMDLINPPSGQRHPFRMMSREWMENHCENSLMVPAVVAIENAINAISPAFYDNNDHWRSK